ncbi:type II toxin-antitoxin system RelE/ParE family toxin [Listeria monocytogenes]|nr:type II toxin-antitoxin system RelE/ParE family toxin [Listeria monocytogenes]
MKVKAQYIIQDLAKLEQKDKKTYSKVVDHILYLEQAGHSLRPPKSKHIEDGIFELRPLNVRVLYCFHDNTAYLLVLYIKKRNDLPRNVIELAKKRRNVIEEE